MRAEARFQVCGRVTAVAGDNYNGTPRVEMVIIVDRGLGSSALFKVACWGSELCEVARACMDRQVLVMGLLSGGKSKAGYFNAYLRADAILVEPESAHAYGAACPEPSPHEQAKADGYAPEPVPLEDESDIPF